MKSSCIEDINQWMSGKTIDHIDNNAVNCNTFYFTDKTAVLMDIEYMGYGIYGPIYREIDPAIPSWKQ